MHFNKSDWFLLCSCVGLHMVSSSHKHTHTHTLTDTLFFSPSDECSVITMAARTTLFLPLLCYDYSFLSVLSGRLACAAAQGLADN